MADGKDKTHNEVRTMEDFFQFSVFDTTKQPFKIDKPIRLIELFAGIGSQAKALERLGIDFEHYRICEFDKYAVASYNAVHGTNFTTSDITKITAKDLGIVDTYKYLYMMTYSFPCQDLSLAGLGKGMQKGSGTRSGLLWEVERLLNECSELPQVLLMENVTQVHGTKNKEHFDEWIKFLESKGYSNYWKDLNAKNFGIPQNRNRTFMVSVLGNYTYEFPKEFTLELRLKDMLEDSVDEKFYISNERVDKIINSTLDKFDEPKLVGRTDKHQKGGVYDSNGISRTIMSTDYKQPMQIVETQERFFKQALETVAKNDCSVGDTVDAFNKRVNKSGVSPTITTRPEGFKTAILPVVEPIVCEQRKDEGLRFFKGDYVGTLRTIDACGDKRVIEPQTHLKIRKLTPKECWRLMGFDDADFEKASQYNSNSQLYKQAGNSIVVDVLYYIFRQMI